MTSQKRSRSTFEAVQLLDSQDKDTEQRRHASSRKQQQQSLAAQSQARVYSSALECRILLQRVMQEADQGNDTGVEECNRLLVQLLEARRTLLRTDDMTDYATLVQAGDELALEDCLASEYRQCRETWQEVLDRRHKDARLHAGLTAKAQFRVLDSAFWQQVESTVAHAEQQVQQPEDVEFDDTKLYQQLLKDFVTASQSGDAQAAQQRLRKQSSSKKKKDIDRRASKGRKIRFNTIPKLVNFTFPLSRPNNKDSNLGEDEWFRSLFGGVGAS